MGFDDELTKREIELAEYRAQTMRQFLHQTVPTVVGILASMMLIAAAIWALWDYNVRQSNNRVKEVEAATAAGLVEQPYKRPGYKGTRSNWVKPEAYEAKVLDDWD